MAFTIRVHLRRAGKNRPPHFLQLRFNAVEQGFKFRARQCLHRIRPHAAILVQPVIKLIRRVGAVEPGQRAGVKTSGMTIRAFARGGGVRRRFVAGAAAVILPAQVHVENAGGSDSFNAGLNPWERWRLAGEFRFLAPDWPAGRRRSQEVPRQEREKNWGSA